MEGLSMMLDSISSLPKRVGIKMNMDMKKIMSNDNIAPTPEKMGDSMFEVWFEKEVGRRTVMRSERCMTFSRPKYQ